MEQRIPILAKGGSKYHIPLLQWTIHRTYSQFTSENVEYNSPPVNADA